MKGRRPAVFVDRDGTLIREKNYLRRPEQVQLIRGSAAGVAALRRAGYAVVLITNQSGIGRGYFTWADLRRAHARMTALLKAKGARLDGVFVCPHAPEARCRCRKPKPLMILRAARRLRLDLKRSFFVGDSTSDMGAAQAAGVPGVLVRTGKCGLDRKCPGTRAARRCRNLGAAARWILRQPGRSSV